MATGKEGAQDRGLWRTLVDGMYPSREKSMGVRIRYYDLES